MDKRNCFKLSPICTALAFIALFPEAHAAQNFQVVPNGTLPTSVIQGSMVTANFMITNLTSTARNGYKIVGFPGTVVQNSTSGNCSNLINLPGYTSCNLQLEIYGAVNINSFAICRGNSCTMVSIPLHVVVNTAPPIPPPPSLGVRMIAGGTYCNSTTCLPLLAQSTNGIWTYPTSIVSNLPTSPTYSNPTFLATDCIGTVCFAAGDNFATGQYPLLAMSLANGDNWTYPIGSSASPLPPDWGTYGPYGSFLGVGIGTSLYITAGEYGQYSTGTPSQFPLLAQSTDGGVTWTYPIYSAVLPADFNDYGFFDTASCGGNICIAGGAYEDDTYNSGIGSFLQPALLAQTIDGGATWAYVIDSSLQPTNFLNNGQFNGSSCNESGTFCVAAGFYTDNSSNQDLFLAQTTNSGATWTFAIDDTVGPGKPTNYLSNANFNSASCSGSLCIAGGYYTDTTSTQVAVLAQSTNRGASWSYVIDDAHGPQLIGASNAQFTATSCSGTVCIAAGYYTYSSATYPLLAQSTDGGGTWAYVINATTGPQLIGLDTQFFNASCRGNTCIAAGQIAGPNPVLVQSINGGAWTYAINTTASTLPSDYIDNGVFYATSISPPLIPDSLSFLYSSKNKITKSHSALTFMS